MTEQDIVDAIIVHVRHKSPGIKLVPASEDAVAEAEAMLGFRLPPLLRLIYLKVANGGFGPVHGVMGVKGGHPTASGTLVETYKVVKKVIEYDGLKWKMGLLPFCYWRGSIYSCVDCGEELFHVWECDGLTSQVEPLKYTLADFFTMWLDGVDIFRLNKPTRRPVMVIIGEIVASTGFDRDKRLLDKWLTLIKSHPALANYAPTKGINPFTRQPCEYRPPPTSAVVQQGGAEIGSLFCPQGRPAILLVDSQEASIDAVATIAEEIARSLGGQFVRGSRVD